MKFEGIYTPVITPYREDFSIDYARLAEVVGFLIEAGVQGITSAAVTERRRQALARTGDSGHEYNV